MNNLKIRHIKLILFCMVCLVLWGGKKSVRAQSPDGRWSNFDNIANTSTASTYPCLAGDRSGRVHVIWSEDIGGVTKRLMLGMDGSPAVDNRGIQINFLNNTGNTLLYTYWDGEKWFDPVDIQVNFSGLVQYVQCAVDRRGILHAVWVGTEGVNARLFYSQVAADQANDAHHWLKPVVLAEQIVFTYYPVDISIDPQAGLHVFYSQLGETAGAYIINSADGGVTWSKPIELYSTIDPNGAQEGVSTLRIQADEKGRLHTTWSRYGADGNGKAIYYARSLDSGKTWSKPFEVAVWQPGWYEVDWLNIGVREDECHLVWEGSSSYATQYERISYDGGATWNNPREILPNIRGENGFADLLLDSAGDLHLFIVKRGDAGSYSNGIWYSTWKNDTWQDPILLGTSNSALYHTAGSLESTALAEALRGTFTGNGLRYQRAVIVNGNELFVIVVNEWDGDLWVSHTTLAAPALPPVSFLTTPTQPLTPETNLTPAPVMVQVTETRLPLNLDNSPPVKLENQLYLVMFGIFPGLILVVGFFLYKQVIRKNQ